MGVGVGVGVGARRRRSERLLQSPAAGTRSIHVSRHTRPGEGRADRPSIERPERTEAAVGTSTTTLAVDGRPNPTLSRRIHPGRATWTRRARRPVDRSRHVVVRVRAFLVSKKMNANARSSVCCGLQGENVTTIASSGGPASDRGHAAELRAVRVCRWGRRTSHRLPEARARATMVHPKAAKVATANGGGRRTDGCGPLHARFPRAIPAPDTRHVASVSFDDRAEHQDHRERVPARGSAGHAGGADAAWLVHTNPAIAPNAALRNTADRSRPTPVPRSSRTAPDHRSVGERTAPRTFPRAPRTRRRRPAELTTESAGTASSATGTSHAARRGIHVRRRCAASARRQRRLGGG